MADVASPHDELKMLQSMVDKGEFNEDELQAALEQDGEDMGSMDELDREMAAMDLATQKSLELNSQLKALAAEHDKVAGEMARLEDQGANGGRTKSGPKRTVQRKANTVARQTKEGGRTYSTDQKILIRRDNINLLSNLERIQRKGGQTTTRPNKVVRHTAASYVNRNKKNGNMARENMALLKRLQGVKSCMGGTGGSPHRRKVVGGSPSNARSRARKPKARPEWQDISVGPPPR